MNHLLEVDTIYDYAAVRQVHLHCLNQRLTASLLVLLYAVGVVFSEKHIPGQIPIDNVAPLSRQRFVPARNSGNGMPGQRQRAPSVGSEVLG